MIRMVTRHNQVARRNVRIGVAVWRLMRTLEGNRGDIKRYFKNDSRRLQHHGMKMPLTWRYQGYVKRDHETACLALKDRLVTRRLRANVKRYAWPGGYLIVAITREGTMLCPDCACTNDRDNPDDRIIGRETIDYVTDGWRPEDAEYTPALCDGCNVDMGTL